MLLFKPVGTFDNYPYIKVTESMSFSTCMYKISITLNLFYFSKIKFKVEGKLTKIWTIYGSISIIQSSLMSDCPSVP